MKGKHKMDEKMQRNLGWRRAMAEEAGRDMGMTEDDFVTGDVADDAEWRQNPEVRRLEKKFETWWRKFQGRREGRRAMEAIHDLGVMILEMEEGLVRENIVGQRACSNEMAKVLRDGGFREFGEAGCKGEYKKVMLGWVSARIRETEEKKVGQRAKCEPRWGVANYDEWYRVYLWGCGCQLRWFDTIMSEGLRWGMDVFGCMGIKDPARYQTMQLEILDLMVVRRLTQFDRLEERWYRQRKNGKHLALEYSQDAGVSVNENRTMIIGECEINGDVSCDSNNNNNENLNEVGAAGRSQEGATSTKQTTRSIMMRYDSTMMNLKMILVYVVLMLACAMSIVV